MLVPKNAHRRHQHLIAYQLLLGLDMEGQSAYRLEKGIKLFDLFRHIDVLFEAHTLKYQLVEVFLQNDFDLVVYCRFSLILTIQRVCKRFVRLELLLSFCIGLVRELSRIYCVDTTAALLSDVVKACVCSICNYSQVFILFDLAIDKNTETFSIPVFTFYGWILS